MKIKQQDSFIITTGEYSNYDVECVAHANKNFDLNEEYRKYEKQNPKKSEYGDVNYGKFIEFLVEQGLIHKPATYEIHLGDGGWDPQRRLLH